MERTLDSTLLHTVRLRLVHDFPAQITACLDVLDDEQVWWRPHEQTNAIGNLLVHLSQSNRYHVEEVLGGGAIGRDREAEFTRRGGLSRDDLRRVWDESVAVVARGLDALTDRPLTTITDRTGKPTTVAQILLHVSHHNALHVGQVLWITKLLRPGALDDIGRRQRVR